MVSIGYGTQETHCPPFRSTYQMLRLLFVLSYHSDPDTGFGGGDTLMKTGADVGVETATAVHWTPDHFQDLPLLVYICPTVGLGGKE
jgi:hypothetical protein